MTIGPKETVIEIEAEPALVHCSSIIEGSGGELICVWYQGAYETSPDTVLMISRRFPAGGWTEAEVFIDFHGLALGNPVLWRSPDGALNVTFSVLMSASWKESLLFCSTSVDDGREWSRPSLFTPRIGMMGKTRPVTGAHGQIIFPVYSEVEQCPYIWLLEDPSDYLSGNFVAETMARGKAIQPVLCRLADDRMLMICRTNQGRLWHSYSYNDGYTWTILRPMDIPNPDSAVDIVRLSNGSLLLVCNDSALDRKCLIAMVSEDGGKTWGEELEIVSGEGEYSYPSVVELESGEVSVSYTKDRYSIIHVQLSGLS